MPATSTGDGTEGEAVPEQAGAATIPIVDWTPLEMWVWERIRHGKVADINARYGKNISPSEQNAAWINSREPRCLSKRFLSQIFTNEQLSKSVSHHGVWIVGACFDELLDLSNTHFARPLRLESTRFERGLWLKRAKFNGFLSLDGSYTGSSIEADDLEDEAGQHIALNMKGVSAGSNVFLRKATLAGHVVLVGANIKRTLETDGSKFEGRLDVGGLTTGESVLLRKGANFEGDVLLTEASIGISLIASRSCFAGDMKVLGTKIKRTFEADRATFKKELDLGGVEVGLSVFLRDQTHIKGKVFLIETKVGDSVVLTGATFENTVDMTRLTSGQGVELRKARCNGEVLLVDAKVDSNLDLSSASFDAKVDLSGAKIQGELRLGSDLDPATWSHNARLVLRDAKVTAIRLDAESGRLPVAWPAKDALELDGLTYDRVNGGRQSGELVADRGYGPSSWYIDLLDRNRSASPQPYQQLATVLRTAGADDEANDILYAGRERERSKASGWSWWGLTLLWATIGYGIGIHYFRALLWVTLFTVIGAGVITFCPPSGADAQRLDGMLAGVFYSLHQLLPIIGLEGKDMAVELEGFARYYFYVHKLVQGLRIA